MRKLLGPAWSDLLLAIALTGLTVAGLVSEEPVQADLPAFLLAVLTVAPLALRQWAPMATTVIIMAALTAYAALGYGEWPNSGVTMVVAMFTVATLRPRRTAALVYLASLVVATVAFFTFPQPVLWSEIAQFVVFMAAAWVVGEGTQRWAVRAERLAEESATAVAQERVRIAREMHDVVSHHMSVISVQAGLAEYVVDSDPPTARTAIATVGDASRQALLEMRRLLDVLRVDPADEAPETYQPQPGLANVEDLVARTRSAGLAVTLTVTGRVRRLSAGLDLCAYRIVQESLTNVLKHAGPATARVEIDYGDLTLTVAVLDDGVTAYGGDPDPGSFGIRGMRERAELYGGVLTAGPCQADGFRVLLRLPMTETEAPVQVGR